MLNNRQEDQKISDDRNNIQNDRRYGAPQLQLDNNWQDEVSLNNNCSIANLYQQQPSIFV